MKKKYVIIIVAIIAILLIPIPAGRLKDGGSRVYKSILYKITKVHRLPEMENVEKGYSYYEGIEIEIFGNKVFDNTKLVKNKDGSDYVKELSFELKDGSLTENGAIFILKNNTDKEYTYGPEYYIEINKNGTWEEYKTITGDPLVWNTVIYTLKPNEEKELIIYWSYGYELIGGTYRVVKKVFEKNEQPIYLYANFNVKK